MARRAPKLVMDDGSRLFSEDAPAAAMPHPQTIVGDVPHYFEIERISSLIKAHGSVAVQFPEPLIHYMAKVLELLQDAHPTGLVFGLIGGCCPDLVTAAHLRATVLVQYGHACLSQGQTSIEIIHSFGHQDINIAACVDLIKNSHVRRLLIFYSLEFAHAVEDLQTILSEQADALVLVGRIPEQNLSASARADLRPCASPSGNAESSLYCCHTGRRDDSGRAVECQRQPLVMDSTLEGDIGAVGTVTIGGLTVDYQALAMFQVGDYSVLYLGSEDNFQFVTIAMRLAAQPPQSWFVVDVLTGEVKPVTGDRASQLLKTRFYLVQKAKLCHVFGILVADVNRDEALIQKTIHSLQEVLREEGHVSYTFVVGTLNPAKLANFGEIDCFIWLACPEHSVLQHNSTEYHAPVVTPYELLVAFERVPWANYETHLSIGSMLKTSTMDDKEHKNDEQADSDAPFFSLVTGAFQQQQERTENNQSSLEADPTSLQQLPGKGIVSTFTSVAAERLQNREYKGLVVDKNAPVGPAMPGRTGIASKYQSS